MRRMGMMGVVMRDAWRWLLPTLWVGMALSCFGASRTPILNGFLQSDFNGNAFTISNATFIGNGAGLVNLPAGGAFSAGNTVWVDAVNGSDNTGTRGRPDKPFANPRKAAEAALSGDTVCVLPGNYFTNNLLMPGVNFYFWPGAQVIHYINSTNSVNSVLEWGIFDDRPSGATTNVIGGYGNFILIGYSNTIGTLSQRINTNALGIITLTNSLSRVTVKCHDLGRSKFLDSGIAACAVEVDNGFLSLDADRIYDPHDSLTITIACLSPVLNLSRGSTSAGLIWSLGQVYARVGENRPYRSYGIWGEGRTTSDVTDLWYSGDVMTGKIYMAADSVTFRSWIKVKALEIADSEPGPSDAQSQAASYFGSGKHYLFAEKIAGQKTSVQAAIDTAPGPLLTSNLFVWITAQKVTASNTWVGVSCGTVEMQVGEFEDLGGVGLNTGGGGLTTAGGGVLYLQCNKPVCTTNGMVARHGGTEMRLTGMTLNSSASDTATNRPVYAASSGLILQNCTLVAPPSAQAIGAATAQTVAIYGQVMASKTNSVNVTLSPLGSFTVDSGVH